LFHGLAPAIQSTIATLDIIKHKLTLSTMADDSPLSIAANITGILTFAVAVLIGIYARIIFLKQEATRIPNMLAEYPRTVFTIRMHLEEVAMLEEMSDRMDQGSFSLLTQLYFRLLTAAIPLATMARKSVLQMRLTWDETNEEIEIELREFGRLKQLLIHKQSILLRQ
jgi:hypothetical protein